MARPFYLASLFLLVACAKSQFAGPGGTDPFPHNHGELSLIDDLGDSSQHDAGAHHDLTLGGPQDLTSGGPDFTLVTGCPVSNLVINEVETHGLNASDEFVELYNTCASGSIAVDNFKVIYRSASATSDSSTLATLSGSIAAGGYLLISSDGYLGLPNPDFVYTGGRLADSGGGVALRDAGGNVVDSVGWGTANNGFVLGLPAPSENPAGYPDSIIRQPNGVNTGHNSADFASAFDTGGKFPSPRAVN